MHTISRDGPPENYCILDPLRLLLVRSQALHFEYLISWLLFTLRRFLALMRVIIQGGGGESLSSGGEPPPPQNEALVISKYYFSDNYEDNSTPSPFPSPTRTSRLPNPYTVPWACQQINPADIMYVTQRLLVLICSKPCMVFSGSMSCTITLCMHIFIH